MNIIVGSEKSEIEIKKSRFICYIKNISTEEEIDDYLNKIKKENINARHFAYSYILDTKEYLTDGGEPRGTAGKPIYNILKQYDLNYIICIVVRYFGGIKLGTGGLIRAYASSAKTTLNLLEIREVKQGLLVELIFAYSKIKQLDYFLNIRNIEIKNKKFDDLVSYEIIILKDTYEKVKVELLNINYNMVINILQEQKIKGELYEKNINYK